METKKTYKMKKEFITIYGVQNCSTVNPFAGSNEKNLVCGLVSVPIVLKNFSLPLDELKDFVIKLKKSEGAVCSDNATYCVWANYRRTSIGTFTAVNNSYVIPFMEIIKAGYDSFAIEIKNGSVIFDSEVEIELQTINGKTIQFKAQDYHLQMFNLCDYSDATTFSVGNNTAIWGMFDPDKFYSEYDVPQENMTRLDLKINGTEGKSYTIHTNDGKTQIGKYTAQGAVYTIPYLEVLKNGNGNGDFIIQSSSNIVFNNEMEIDVTYQDPDPEPEPDEEPKIVIYPNNEYGDNKKRQIFDVYLPSPNIPNGGFPVVLTLHGGAWSEKEGDDFYSRKYYNKFIMDWLVGNGYACVNMDYRLIQDFSEGEIPYEGMLDDIKSVISELIDDFDGELNTTKIALMGFSAGAHLSLLYAYSRKDSPIPVKLVISEAGPIDLNSLYEDYVNNNGFNLNENDKTFLLNAINGLSGDTTETARKKASPLYCVNENNPPKDLKTLLVYSSGYNDKDNDGLIPYNQATKLQEELYNNGLDCQLIQLSNKSHYQFINAIDDDLYENILLKKLKEYKAL